MCLLLGSGIIINFVICVGIKSSIESAPDCWICLHSGNVNDLFKPCRCSAVHKSCLYTWLAEVCLEEGTDTFES